MSRVCSSSHSLGRPPQSLRTSRVSPPVMLVRNRGRCTGGPGTTALYASFCPLGEIAGNPRLTPGSPSILASEPFSRFLTWSRLPVMLDPEMRERPAVLRHGQVADDAGAAGQATERTMGLAGGGVDRDRPEVDVGVSADETETPSGHRRKERVIAARCHGLRCANRVEGLR